MLGPFSLQMVDTEAAVMPTAARAVLTLGWSHVLYTLVGGLAYFLWSIRARRLPGIPSPGWVPFFGNLFIVFKNRNRMWEWYSCCMLSPAPASL